MSIAVLINANSRRGSTKFASWVSELLPSARLKLTHSADDARKWLREEIRPHPPQLLPPSLQNGQGFFQPSHNTFR